MAISVGRRLHWLRIWQRRIADDVLGERFCASACARAPSRGFRGKDKPTGTAPFTEEGGVELWMFSTYAIV